VPHLLHLDSSADATGSVSRAVTGGFAQAWRGLGADHTLTHRDLHADPPPHLPDVALHWAPQLRADGEATSPAAEARQQELLAELLAADVLLVGAPMYNYTVASTLKAWIDHIHVIGVTAPFGPAPQPMAGRTAVVVVSSGLTYGEGTPLPHGDHVTPVLRQVLGDALGMTVVPVVVGATLSTRLAPLEALRPRYEQERAAALEQVRTLAAELG
jgi:FMN-dependent NADH-azoreductase